MKAVVFLLFLSIINCFANEVGSVFSIDRFCSVYVNSENEGESIISNHLIKYYGSRDEDFIIDQFLKDEFVSKNEPFVLIDSRLLPDGAVELFAYNDHEYSGKADFLNIHKIKSDMSKVWSRALTIGKRLSEFEHLDDRTSGTGGLRALPVLVFDGTNLHYSIFIDFTPFGSAKTHEQESLLKYLSLAELIRCLVYSSAWDGAQLRAVPMLLLDADFQFLNKYCEGVAESERKPESPVDPFN